MCCDAAAHFSLVQYHVVAESLHHHVVYSDELLSPVKQFMTVIFFTNDEQLSVCLTPGDVLAHLARKDKLTERGGKDGREKMIAGKLSTSALLKGC